MNNNGAFDVHRLSRQLATHGTNCSRVDFCDPIDRFTFCCLKRKRTNASDLKTVSSGGLSDSAYHVTSESTDLSLTESVLSKAYSLCNSIAVQCLFRHFGSLMGCRGGQVKYPMMVADKDQNIASGSVIVIYLVAANKASEA